ncbi:hypothetical protein PoB_007536500 [Plakobranchus ocellatus]|uniref:Uncharacterized protein n=1 Tax=Plakobranchus ocellatus TaxID=259542 RepID=A0AAV4DXX2_9GAST|nr:hypothetical protein PoB_007536500 [Plakobranchus ocellatus]
MKLSAALIIPITSRLVLYTVRLSLYYIYSRQYPRSRLPSPIAESFTKIIHQVERLDSPGDVAIPGHTFNNPGICGRSSKNIADVIGSPPVWSVYVGIRFRIIFLSSAVFQYDYRFFLGRTSQRGNELRRQLNSVQQ